MKRTVTALLLFTVLFFSLPQEAHAQFTPPVGQGGRPARTSGGGTR